MTKSIASARMGIGIRRKGNTGSASWSDREIGQPVWQYAYQEPNYTVYVEAEEHKSVTSISVGLVSEGENSRRKRTSKKEHENATSSFAGLKERAETVAEDARKGTRKC